MVDLEADAVELVESRYAEWTDRFEAERTRLRDALDAADLDDRVHRIEHVGSTAVPDLAAKDVVDVDLVVGDGTVVDVASAVETRLGGTRYDNGDGWNPVARCHDGQRFNVHVFGRSDDGWKTSVATRDVLRARSGLCDEYERLKRDLAAEHDDLEAYSIGKTAFVETVLRTAREADDLSFGFEVPRVE
ncbi:GrpB family protein [Haloarchaeobius sp. HRN-SO-5]|uniref:GrpB family protein n=1 Tax=Haloarchaeobius sp. HRN-SO-5 TaxID=3446118 RepID=UPI003EB8CAEE